MFMYMEGQIKLIWLCHYEKNRRLLQLYLIPARIHEITGFCSDAQLHLWQKVIACKTPSLKGVGWLNVA